MGWKIFKLISADIDGFIDCNIFNLVINDFERLKYQVDICKSAYSYHLFIPVLIDIKLFIAILISSTQDRIQRNTEQS